MGWRLRDDTQRELWLSKTDKFALGDVDNIDVGQQSLFA